MKKLVVILFVALVSITAFLIAQNNNRVPKGWHFGAMNTSLYETGIDNSTFESGHSSVYIKSNNTDTKEFGNIMQAINAENYLGKRLRLTGYIKSENVTGSCQMWMRIDGQSRGESLAFDNMQDRQIKGTTDWKQYSIVLDVPANSRIINYGALIVGTGKMWIDSFKIEEVNKSVPVTDISKINNLPSSPVNLDFEE